ncbi:MAG: hypothetical protein D6808_05175 [Candidatus Dadabacteria bacterium]|nr:MAG: hypothetical protein D6808_05175 [Candidatus Dadabacteria bacterium]
MRKVYLFLCIFFVLGILMPLESLYCADRNICTSHHECVPKKNNQIEQCITDNDCDTECAVNGAGTGMLYPGDVCGECTVDSCRGKTMGSICELEPGAIPEGYPSGIKGRCEATEFCSKPKDPQVYTGACGLSCSCKIPKQKNLQSAY